MPGAPMKPEELRRYADMIVRGCIAFRRGDTLLELVSFGHRDLAVAIAEAAYRAGALAVDVAYEDNRVYAAKIQHASKEALGHHTPWKAAQWRAFGEESVAIVQVMGEYELDVVADLSPERVAADSGARNRYVARIRREARLRGTICAWPTDEWAARVFPGLDAAKAKRKLAQELLWFCRLGPDDPAGHKGWTQHLAALRRRAARLTKLDLKEVHVLDDGTDLRLKIAPFSMWRGGGEQDFWGRRIAMNVPTEESFTSPHAAGTNGTFACSFPLSFQGRLIEGLRGEFRGGKLVRLDASNKQDRDFVAAYIDGDPRGNGRKLGEVALVDATSRIGQSGRTYFHTLLDENAAAHIAFGAGFGGTRTGSRAVGLNRATVHLDVMIGGPDFEATGITASGKRVPVIADGLWQI
ncbi:MAG TPA: aminopeptidase [Gaiellaceae bacterium]